MKNLLFVIGFIVGCNSPEESAASLSYNLEYYKDEKTGVCYSGAYIANTMGMFTSVPCNPEVEKVAVKFKSGLNKR